MRFARRRPDRVEVPGLAVLPVAVLAGLGQYLLTSWLSGRHLVTGSPVVMAVLLGLVVLLGTRAVQLAVGRGRLDTFPVARLLVAFVLFAALTWTAGWSFILPATAILVGVVQIQRTGSRVRVPALVLVTVFTLAGQVGVELGWVSTIAYPIVSHVGAASLLVVTIAGLVVAGSAVAEREDAQATVERTEARLRALMESSSDVLTVSDADGALTYVSPAATRVLGRAPHELLGRPLLELADEEQRPQVAEAVASVIDHGTGARTSIDVLVELADRERRWFEWSVHNLLGDPLVTGLVIVQRDVTDRLRHQEALAHAASHDDLTGLPNRSDLLERIDSAAAQAALGAGFAVLFLDLDHFKEVNDAHGHAAGDEVLRAIARRLRGALRPQDHLARVSGDEFCGLLAQVRDEAEVDAVIDRLKAVVAQPIALDDGQRVSVGVSIGRALTFAPRSAEELFTSADTQMYVDKRAHLRATSPVALSDDAARRSPATDGRPA